MSSPLFTTQVVGKRAFVLDHKGQVSGRPTVNLILSGIKVTALVDTGASCTLLRRDIFDLIVRKTHRACLLEHSLERNGNCSTGALRIKTHGLPICQKAYRMPLSKRKVVEEMIKEMLDDDIICPSNSAYSSPILLVRKKDGESRLCVDCRILNEVTHKDAYPLPHIQ